MVDILLQNWFLVDLIFIIPKSNEEEEGVAKPLLRTPVVRINKVWGVRFQRAPIDIDEKMEDVKEICWTNTQLETSRQLEISPMFLSTF